MKRLERSYRSTFESMITFLTNETSKAMKKIEMLLNKNRHYERIFNEIKKKEEEDNKYADIILIKNKLDFVENEISISKIFEADKQDEAHKSFLNALGEKLDPNSKDAVSQLQEILSTMYNLTHSNSSLLQLNPLERPNFKMDDWEKEFMSKMKGAQFSAAKSIVGMLKNKDKFKDSETQTEEDPLKEMYKELEQSFEKLQRRYNSQKDSLDHIQLRYNAMKKSHEEERHRWINREKEMVKIETKQKEIELKFKQAKSEETGFKYKIKELGADIVK